MPRIAAAISGGLDSLCALLLLKRAGLDVLALHALLAADSPPPGLEDACAKLGVPLKIVDLRQDFASLVIDPFLAGYAAGASPNPCALCNRDIKFGALLDFALGLGAEKLATGHYLRLEKTPWGPAPGPAADFLKDQGYFLSLVPSSRLKKTLFPLASLNKSECRVLLAEAGLKPPLPKESHDICFVQGRDYRDFLAERLPAPAPGPIIHAGTGRIIGRHRGLWRHTEGQRRGIGAHGPKPLYVLAKDGEKGILFVGTAEMLGARRCLAGQINIFTPPEYWPQKIFARLRYRRAPAAAAVKLENDKLVIDLQEPGFSTAPGQLACLMDESGRILAGGILEKVEPLRPVFRDSPGAGLSIRRGASGCVNESENTSFDE